MPVVETIMDKGTAMRGTYEKARVAERAVKYRVYIWLTTII